MASAREKHQKDLDAHFKKRREQGLPAHRPQELLAEVGNVKVVTLAGVTYVQIDTESSDKGEVALNQTEVGNLILALQAAFQAVS